MTMKRPSARIICIQLNDEIARSGIGSRRHDHNITSLGILGTDDRRFVCGTEAAVEDLHVVAVQMYLGTSQYSVDSCVVN